MSGANSGQGGSVKLWTLESLPGVELVRASYHEHRFPKHSHEKTVIAVNTAGVTAFFLRGVEHLASPGHVVFVEAGEVHTGRRVGGETWSYRGIHVDPSILRQVVRKASLPGVDPSFPRPVVYDPELADRFCEAHARLEDPPEPREAKAVFLNLMTLLVGRCAEFREPRRPASHAGEATRAAQDYLKANLERSVSVSEVARVVGWSRAHLIRQFHSEIGVPPHRFLVNCRVEKAQKLLARGMSPRDVAHAVGFADQSHLGYHFKRVVGMTPRAYARAAARGRPVLRLLTPR